MPPLSAWTVRASLLWLAAAALVGAMLLSRQPLGHPEWGRLLPVHAEMMMVGWMMQLAFGVAHWILPRQTSPPGPLSLAGEGGRGSRFGVLLVVLALNLGVTLVIAGLVLPGRILEAGAAVGFAAQAFPRIKAAGWGATGKEGDLVRLK